MPAASEMASTPVEAGRLKRKPWLGETLRWVVVTLLIPFVGFVWNEYSKRQAARQRDVEQRRADSELVVKLLPALVSDPDSPSRAVALAVLVDLQRNGVVGKGMADGIQAALEESERRVREGRASPSEVSALTRIAVTEDKQAVRVAGRAAPTTVVEVPRLYIQIYDEVDRVAAEQLRRWARESKRWLAPGIENVTRTAAAKGTQVPRGSADARVLYFNDDDKPRAEAVGEWLREGNPTAVTVTRSDLAASPGQIEAWFPARGK